MSLLNTSEAYNSHSPRPRQRRSVEIGTRMSWKESTGDNKRRSPRKSPRKTPRLSPIRTSPRLSPRSSPNKDSADQIRPIRRSRREGSDLGSMPIMFEVDGEESSRSTGIHSASFHTARSDRSRSRSREGSGDQSSTDPDVVEGTLADDVFTFDTAQDPNKEFHQPSKIKSPNAFQLDNVQETPEHLVKAMLRAGVDHSSTPDPASRIIPTLSLDDDYDGEEETGEADEEVHNDASEEVEDSSEESDYEEESDDENEESDDDDDEEGLDSDEDEEMSDSDETESEEEESEEFSEESEVSKNAGDAVFPATMCRDEKLISKLSNTTSNAPKRTISPPRTGRRIQHRDMGMSFQTNARNQDHARPQQNAYSLQADALPAQTRQRTRSHERTRAPQMSNLSNSLQVGAPPCQSRPRTRSQDRIRAPRDKFSNTRQLDVSSNHSRSRARSQDRMDLDLDAPPSQSRPRARSQDGMDLDLDAPPSPSRPRARSQDRMDLDLDVPPSQSRPRARSQDRMDLNLDAPPSQSRPRARSHDRMDFSNSLELDAPPLRQPQRMKSQETHDELDSFPNSHKVDVPATHPRQRMKSHESQDEFDEDEAADTIADLPMPAPRTRTRTRQRQNQPNRMMSFEPFAIGNLSDTLQVDVGAPQQQQGHEGTRRTRARDRIMSVGPDMQNAPDIKPKQRMPRERRLSLDSRRHVYEDENRFNTASGTSVSSGDSSNDGNITDSPPKKNKSSDDVEASPGAKNRRRLRSADDLAEFRMQDVESVTPGSGRTRPNMYRRISGGAGEDAPRREKAVYLLGMQKGSVAQGQELQSSMPGAGGVPPFLRGPMSTRQPRQRSSSNRFKPLPPPPSNDDLDIDDMVAIRRFSKNQVAKRPSTDSDDTFEDGLSRMEYGGAFPNRPNQQRHSSQRSRSAEMDQKDPTQLDEKQFWLIVTFLTALGVIFGFVAVKVHVS